MSLCTQQVSYVCCKCHHIVAISCFKVTELRLMGNFFPSGYCFFSGLNVKMCILRKLEKSFGFMCILRKLEKKFWIHGRQSAGLPVSLSGKLYSPHLIQTLAEIFENNYLMFYLILSSDHVFLSAYN